VKDFYPLHQLVHVSSTSIDSMNIALLDIIIILIVLLSVGVATVRQ